MQPIGDTISVMGPDTIELLSDKAKTGDERAVDEFFYELLELVSLAQGVNVAPLIDKALWFKDNPVTRKGHAHSLLTQGFADSFYSRYSVSIEHCNEASRIFAEMGFPDGVAMCSTVTGTNYRGYGNIELAIKYMTEAYTQLHKTDQNLHFTIASGHQLADLYTETGKHTDALALCLEVLPLTQSPANKKRMFDARLLNTIGSIYARLGDHEPALRYFRDALKQSEEVNQLPVTARVLTDMGNFFLGINDFDNSIAYNERALAIREQVGLRNPMLTNIINIAKVYALQGRTDDAICALHRGYTIASDLQANAKLLQVLKPLSALYEQKGEIVTSLAYYKQYHTLLEEQNRELQEQKITNIKLAYEAQQAIKENEVIKAQKAELEKEKRRSDALLLNILPHEVAEELKQKDVAEARFFSNVTILFTDFIDFTAAADRFSPKDLVHELHTCFKAFDDITGKYGIEKIKTVGDAYLAVGGLPAEDPRHAEHVVRAAIEIRDFIKARKAQLGDATFEIRIGINSGSVVAGIVGVKKFAYDIWGDAVNTAARMEQNSEAGKINISEMTYELVKHLFKCECRGEIPAKGKGMLRMYYVEQ